MFVNLYENEVSHFKITEGSPNKETVSAMLEAERIAKDSTIDGYKNVDELFADLDA